jgi:hypothetical protein
MPSIIPSVPTSFDLEPFADHWFSWDEIWKCFRPGRGGRAEKVNPTLAPVRWLGGVYLFAWCIRPPERVHPSVKEVRYIGETNCFNQRMIGFSSSAGFQGDRAFGHSAAWRWPKGRSEHAWVAFFPLGEGLPAHLATGLRKWMEAVALEEYRLLHGGLPEVNEATSEVCFSSP